MNENVLLSELNEGDDVIGFFALKRCELKQYDGGFRLDVELSDKSGNIPGVVWDDAQRIREQVAKGDVVKVQGRLLSYRDLPQVRIDKIRPAGDDEYESESFLPSTPADVNALKVRTMEFIESIKDPHLSSLGKMIFENDHFMKEYSRAPGGMKWHHPYLGGLLEHSVNLTEICDFVTGKHPELNRDLLVLAGLLHDVGKIKEYAATTMIDFTDEGRLEGHIVIGERFVRNMCERVDNFPPKLKMLLSHLMLSHQGHKEFSTPVEPMIPEAFVLYYADEIDSKLNAIGRITEKTRNDGKKWSEFIRAIGRYIFVDRDEESTSEIE